MFNFLFDVYDQYLLSFLRLCSIFVICGLSWSCWCDSFVVGSVRRVCVGYVGCIACVDRVGSACMSCCLSISLIMFVLLVLIALVMLLVLGF